MTVYADNAATTRMSRTALDAMLPAMEENYGNPSSLHSVGQRAAELLMKSRETVARCLNCQPREIIFTSGGSEADNQALLSAAAIGRRKGKMHIISTAFEHHAILHTLKKLEKEKAITEDEQKKAEAEVQKLTDKFVADADKRSQAKEKEIMDI